MEITIDPNSGFCFGVVHAIQAAEYELDRSGRLYCLGDIVHNNMEVERLKERGLKIITVEELKNLRDCKVLIRAHGEPPETYLIALKNNITLIDASCPVVLKLQQRIRAGFDEMNQIDGQIVIYGKEKHAEVNGLVGQAKERAIVINDEKNIGRIDFLRPVRLFSQTTQSTEGFNKTQVIIRKRMQEANKGNNIDFVANDTICRQVSGRAPQIREFAARFDVVLFVSGKNSSNGLFLFNVCRVANSKTYFISSPDELRKEWFAGSKSVGICGATSAPMWLMEDVSTAIRQITSL